MFDLEKIIAVNDAEIKASESESKGTRIYNLIKEGTVYRALSKYKIDGDFLISAQGLDDQAVSIEWLEGVCYIDGIDSEIEVISSASVHKDSTALAKAVQEGLLGLKAGDKIIHNPQIIIGAPGSGKTVVITKIVEEELLLGRRVLVVSPTNKAVENVFERIDFDAIGLTPGAALLAIRTNNESLTSFSPRAVAETKIKPINDELELLEAVLPEIAKTKRDADSVLAALSSEEDSASIMLSNLQRDEVQIQKSLKKAKVELGDCNSRLNAINSNILVRTFAGTFLSTKISEIESTKLVDQKAITNMEVQLDDIETKKTPLLKSRDSVIKKIDDANVIIQEAIKSKAMVVKRIDELKIEKEDILSLNLFGSARLVGATLMGAALNKKINSSKFDVIICDEASMASLPVLALACKAVKIIDITLTEPKQFEGLYEAQVEAINKSLSSQFILVGDPKQLSPIAKTKEARRTVFDVYDAVRILDGEVMDNVVLLNINYRNHPDIVELVSNLFYGGMLKSGREHNGKKSLFIRNVKSSCKSHEGSYINHGSAAVIHEQTSQALAKGRRSVGVISPYRKQADNINNMMSELRETYSDADVQAGTVHSFQGQEKAVVMFDITASAGSNLHTSFKGDMNSEAARLLNVATTRACDFFVLVGDVDGLEKQMSTIQGHENMVFWKWIQGIKQLAYK